MFKVMWRQKIGNGYGKWHFHSEHNDLLQAKHAAKAVKVWLGHNGGSVKIVK